MAKILFKNIKECPFCKSTDLWSDFGLDFAAICAPCGFNVFLTSINMRHPTMPEVWIRIDFAKNEFKLFGIPLVDINGLIIKFDLDDLNIRPDFSNFKEELNKIPYDLFLAFV